MNRTMFVNNNSLGLTNDNNKPLVKEFGPQSAAVGTHFNVQHNGQSAMWFALNDNSEGDMVVEFDGYYLKSARSANVLSALVPDDLLGVGREIIVKVFDADRPERRSEVVFNLIGMAPDIGSPVGGIPPNLSINPNFFIVGAPRSGTTTMYWELASHPNIFMTRIKEPFFFDERAYGVLTDAVMSEEKYRELFCYVPLQASIVGEASTTYLSSASALNRIHEFNEDAKILVMLRNPIAASVSFYSQMKRGGKYENISNFENAWNCDATNERAFLTRYSEIYQIGQQLLRAEAIFGRKNIKVTIFDDLVADSNFVYRDIIDFLGLDAGVERSIPCTNSSGCGDVRSIVSDDLLEKMVAHFRPEVDVVAEYTQRNLDHWLML